MIHVSCNRTPTFGGGRRRVGRRGKELNETILAVNEIPITGSEHIHFEKVDNIDHGLAARVQRFARTLRGIAGINQQVVRMPATNLIDLGLHACQTTFHTTNTVAAHIRARCQVAMHITHVNQGDFLGRGISRSSKYHSRQHRCEQDILLSCPACTTITIFLKIIHVRFLSYIFRDKSEFQAALYANTRRRIPRQRILPSNRNLIQVFPRRERVYNLRARSLLYVRAHFRDSNLNRNMTRIRRC